MQNFITFHEWEVGFLESTEKAVVNLKNMTVKVSHVCLEKGQVVCSFSFQSFENAKFFLWNSRQLQSKQNFFGLNHL